MIRKEQHYLSFQVLYSDFPRYIKYSCFLFYVGHFARPADIYFGWYIRVITLIILVIYVKLYICQPLSITVKYTLSFIINDVFICFKMPLCSTCHKNIG
ncbi:MAG: hypothetical protein DRP46_11570 [Candidatus Zixiibacteriota bacterium]|nr:MAG: hypothetical protein DRP46_11570 [candidate division Zixibacteria bacterium]